MSIKKLLLGIATILPTFLFIGNVSAGTNDATITYQRIDGAYFYLQNKSTGAVDTNYVTKFFLNGKIAYCIEPMIDINDRIFNSTNNWNITNLSSEQRKFIEMVGHFGYDYPSHQTDKYWLASQQLIWEKANSNVSVKITNGANGTGGDYNLTNERNEILRLINEYEKLPSFANQLIEGNSGYELVINDTNNLLSGFTMSYNGKHTVTKNGNTLKIKFADNEFGTETISFTKPNYDNQSTTIYYQGSSQKLATLRISNPLTFSINIKGNGTTVDVNKKGEELVYGNASFKFDEIQLPNVTFLIYANEDIQNSKGEIIYKKYQLVDTLTTDSTGIAKLTDMYYGSYFITEGESSLNHILDDKKYYFEITKDDIENGKLVKHFDFKNLLPKGTLEFTKTDVSTGKPIPNTEIQIFTEDDRLIFTGKTDKNGKLIIELPLYNGTENNKYYILERNPANGYKLTDEKIYFEIKENGEIVKVNMTNEKIETPKKEIVKVPMTGLNDFSSVLSIVVIIIGLGALIYEKKKQK